MLRRLLLTLAVSTALVVPATSAAAPSQPSQPRQAPIAHAACTKAKIGGASKCIAAGQFCAKRYESDYRKYGFTCSKRDRKGNWHLQYR